MRIGYYYVGDYNMPKHKAETLIPNKLSEFLSAHAGQRIEFNRKTEPDMEVDNVEFFKPTDLKLSKFTIYTHEYHLNYGEPGEDPELEYEVEGIDLIRDCNDYDPEGILIYFPEFHEFGSWDCDHLIIIMFPNVEWPTIEANLSRYVNAQWYSHLVDQYLLRPWADRRCKNIKPKPS
jgi:hypothetical protein